MVTIEEAKKDIAQAKISLSSAKSSLPKLTQQVLRKNKLSSLQGRETRRSILGQEKNIAEQERFVSEYEQGVISAENQYNLAVAKQQEEIKEQQLYREAVIAVATGADTKSYPKQILERAIQHVELYQGIGTLPEEKVTDVEIPSVTQPIIPINIPTIKTSEIKSNNLFGVTSRSVEEVSPNIQNVKNVISNILAGPKESLKNIRIGITSIISGRPSVDVAEDLKMKDIESSNIFKESKKLQEQGYKPVSTTSGVVYTKGAEQIKGLGYIEPTKFSQRTEGINLPSLELNRREVYNPDTGRYEYESRTGRGGTLESRQESLSERNIRLEKEERNQSNLATADVRLIREQQRELSKVSSTIKDLEKNFDKDTGEWTGTEADYKKYTEQFNKLQELDSIETPTGYSTPTIKAGILGLTQEIPITDIKTDVTRPINILSQTFVSTVAGTTGALAKKGSEQFNILSNKITGGNKYAEGTYTVFNQRPAITYPEVAEKYGQVVGTIGAYSIPVLGNTMFLGSATENILGSMAKEDKVIKGIGTYITEEPLEAVALATYGATKAYTAYKGAKINRFFDIKESQANLEPSSYYDDIINTQREVPKVIRSRQPATEGGITVFPAQENIKFSSSVKGGTTTTYNIPSKDLSGSYLEKIKKFNLFSNADEIGTGVASITDDVYTSTVEFGKGYKKITNIGKEGTGTVSLFKGEKLIETRFVSGADELISSATKNVKIDIDDLTNTKLRTTESNILGVKSKVLEKVGDTGTDDLINLAGTADDLTRIEKISTKQTGTLDIGLTTEKYTGGTTVQRMDTSGFFDIITAGEKKRYAKASKGGATIVIKQRQPPEILFGNPKDIDVSGRTFTETGVEVIRKEITPNVFRDITQSSGTNVLISYKNPKYFPDKVDVKTVSNFDKAYVNLLNIQEKARNMKNVYETLVPTEVVETGATVQIAGGGELTDAIGKLGLNEKAIVYVEPASKFLKEIPKVSTPSISFSTVAPVKEANIFGLGALAGLELGTKEIIKQKEQLKTEELFQTKVETKLDVNLDTKQNVFTSQPLAQKNIQQQKLSQLNILELLQQQSTRESQRQEGKSKQRPTKVKQPIKPLAITPLQLKSKPSARERLKDMFEVFKWSKGEEVSVGTTENLFKAGKKLRSELKSGLEASGYILSKQTGQRVPFSQVSTIVGSEFRPAKKDITRIVQKRGTRLSTGSEVFKIKQAKKSKRWL